MPPTGQPVLAGIVDRVIEAVVPLSFSRQGQLARRRLFAWGDPVHDSGADLTGRVVLITGATSGIGEAAATRLAAAGAKVHIVGRSADGGQRARRRIVASSANHDVHSWALDVGELGACRRFASEFTDRVGRLDVLVHNAGALLSQRRETSDGIEVTTAVHLVGPYLLSRLLEPLVAESGGRILFTSSGGMYTVALDPHKLDPSAGDYDGRAAYARAKRAQVVMAALLAGELAQKQVTVAAWHPGWVATSGLFEGLPAFARLGRPLFRTADEGADTLVWLCGAAEPVRRSGVFWHDRRERPWHKVAWTRKGDARGPELMEWLDRRVHAASVVGDGDSRA